jgi:transcription elongation factor GreA
MEKMPITRAGFEKLKKDLEHLRNVDLPENVRDIEVARAHGDLSENAEYKSAKERQAFIHARIKEVEQNLSAVRSSSEAAATAGRFGCTVAIDDLKSGDNTEYRLVGPFESEYRGEQDLCVPLPSAGLSSAEDSASRSVSRSQAGAGVRCRVFVEPE